MSLYFCPDFPLIFHSVCGLDQREHHSPSFFNLEEAVVVVDYLEKLITEKGMLKVSVSLRSSSALTRMTPTRSRFQVLPKDIGVITPYRRQVVKIKDLMHRKLKQKLNIQNCMDVTVGSTEEFQVRTHALLHADPPNNHFPTGRAKRGK